MKKILFYGTYGGYGHIARDLAIAKHLGSKVKLFFVSGMKWIGKLPGYIEFKQLKEIPQSQIIDKDGSIIFKSFYKGNTTPKDYGKHVIEYINVLKEINPDIVVVDLTSEITMITKLLGYKVITVYETGIRNDLRHLLGYRSCDYILVPYNKGFTDVSYLRADIRKKMFFSGGFCRFDGYKIIAKDKAKKKINISKKLVLVSVGKGDYAKKLIKACVEALKELKDVHGIIFFPNPKLKKKIPNIDFSIVKPADIPLYLNAADLVISSTGYSTIMENCYFRVPMITIPLKRPYQEQTIKAQNLRKIGAAEVLYEKKINKELLLDKIGSLLNNSKRIKQIISAQKKIIDGYGSKRAANWLMNIK